MYTIVSFIDKIAFKVFYLVYHQIPTTKVKISHTEVNTLNSWIGYQILQPVYELGFDVIIDIGHKLYF